MAGEIFLVSAVVDACCVELGVAVRFEDVEVGLELRDGMDAGLSTFVLIGVLECGVFHVCLSPPKDRESTSGNEG